MGLLLSIFIVVGFCKSWQTKKTHYKFSGVPGIICNFSNKNLITFESTAPTNNCFNPEQKKDYLLCFVRVRWSVTKKYSYYIFEQECFKKEFILMNQSSRYNAKNSIEKDFYKLMNNSNFGYDCCNTLDNCQFVPIFDEL